MTIPYAAYRKMVLMAVTTMMAVPPPRMNATRVNSQLITTMPISEFAGVRYLCETFFNQPEAGSPSSRLKAKSMRPAEAIDDRPQKAMAMAMPADRMSPRLPRL